MHSYDLNNMNSWTILEGKEKKYLRKKKREGWNEKREREREREREKERERDLERFIIEKKLMIDFFMYPNYSAPNYLASN